MSWKMWATALSFGIALNVAGPTAHASDRKDGPATSGAASIDIVDLYSWMDPTGKNVYFILTVNPDATNISVFDPNALYVIHTSARTGLNDTSPAADVPIICTVKPINSTTTVDCWVGKSTYLRGGLNRVVSSPDAKFSFYVGRANDPYFGYDTATNGVGGMVANIKTTLAGGGTPKTRNGQGCYAFAAAEMMSARTALTMGGSATTDSYSRRNVLAIQLSVAKDLLLLTPGKTSLAVWATTNRPM